MSMSGDPKERDAGRSAQAPLPPELQGQIGQRLRDAYIELINEPVPDRFVSLLQQLKSKETDASSGGA